MESLGPRLPEFMYSLWLVFPLHCIHTPTSYRSKSMKIRCYIGEYIAVKPARKAAAVCKLLLLVGSTIVLFSQIPIPIHLCGVPPRQICSSTYVVLEHCTPVNVETIFQWRLTTISSSVRPIGTLPSVSWYCATLTRATLIMTSYAWAQQIA